MTKSKGTGRGGSRKGAGRPAVMGKSETFSTRITPALRDQIEAEAKRRGVSISAVTEDLLTVGLEETADLQNPRHLRSLLFLMEELGQQLQSWRTNPYIFEAFRAGVLHLLDTVRPPGRVVAPTSTGRWMTYPDSPEQFGQWALRTVFAHMERQELTQVPEREMPRGWLRHHYNYVAAKRDLRLGEKAEGEKK
jgi:hypothetical protein